MAKYPEAAKAALVLGALVLLWWLDLQRLVLPRPARKCKPTANPLPLPTYSLAPKLVAHFVPSVGRALEVGTAAGLIWDTFLCIAAATCVVQAVIRGIRKQRTSAKAAEKSFPAPQCTPSTPKQSPARARSPALQTPPRRPHSKGTPPSQSSTPSRHVPDAGDGPAENSLLSQSATLGTRDEQEEQIAQITELADQLQRQLLAAEQREAELQSRLNSACKALVQSRQREADVKQLLDARDSRITILSSKCNHLARLAELQRRVEGPPSPPPRPTSISPPRAVRVSLTPDRDSPPQPADPPAAVRHHSPATSPKGTSAGGRATPPGVPTFFSPPPSSRKLCVKGAATQSHFTLAHNGRGSGSYSRPRTPTRGEKGSTTPRLNNLKDRVEALESRMAERRIRKPRSNSTDSTASRSSGMRFG